MGQEGKLSQLCAWTKRLGRKNVLRNAMVGRLCRPRRLLISVSVLGVVVFLVLHWLHKPHTLVQKSAQLPSPPSGVVPPEVRSVHDLPPSIDGGGLPVNVGDIAGEGAVPREGLKNATAAAAAAAASARSKVADDKTLRADKLDGKNRDPPRKSAAGSPTPSPHATASAGGKLSRENGGTATPSLETQPYLVFGEGESPLSRIRWPEGVNTSGSAPKIIEWYNAPRWWRRLGFRTLFRGCPVQSCTVHYDGKKLKEADAVIVHGRDIPSDEPPPRKPGQVYVWFTIEAPANHYAHHHKAPKWIGAFNWTMMYRRDSDIWLPYGFLRRVARPSPRNFTRILGRKSRSVSWLVSNMHAESRRHEYVSLLKRFVPVDMYGRCRKLCTPWRANNPEWNDFVTERYRFYLAFENNHCRDYVTEKMFKTFGSEVVPVVRGGPWLEYEKFFPKGTFVDAGNFKSVKALADHLKHLEGNPREYVSILEKRSRYRIGDNVDFTASAMCQLCVRLHNLDKFHKTYPNIHSWLADNVCDNNVKDLVLQ